MQKQYMGYVTGCVQEIQKLHSITFNSNYLIKQN